MKANRRVTGAALAAAAASQARRRDEPCLAAISGAQVLEIPSREAVEAIGDRHPDARIEILVSPGRRLSHELQDGHSFRYGIINLGARDREQAMDALADCRRRLPFSFSGG